MCGDGGRGNGRERREGWEEPISCQGRLTLCLCSYKARVALRSACVPISCQSSLTLSLCSCKARVALCSACVPISCQGSLTLCLCSWKPEAHAAVTECSILFVYAVLWMVSVSSARMCHVISHCDKQKLFIAYIYNSNTWETEAKGSEAQGRLELHDTLYPPPPIFCTHAFCSYFLPVLLP